MGLRSDTHAGGYLPEKPAPPSEPVISSYAKEVQGKTRCAMFSAALQSQVLAQYLYAKEVSFEELIALVSKVADEGVKYTFGE